MYKRSEYQVITSRLKEPRKFIQVVMGPRQVGKSTVVKQVLQDLDLPYQQFSADNVPASNTAWVSNCWAAVRSLKYGSQGVGRIFESGIGAWIVSQAFVHRIEVFYWRELANEVDFVLRKKGTVVAIEVKSNAEKNTKGLSEFRDKFKPKSAFIVGDGGISAEEFLSMDIRNLFK